MTLGRDDGCAPGVLADGEDEADGEVLLEVGSEEPSVEDVAHPVTASAVTTVMTAPRAILPRAAAFRIGAASPPGSSARLVARRDVFPMEPSSCVRRACRAASTAI